MTRTMEQITSLIQQARAEQVTLASQLEGQRVIRDEARNKIAELLTKSEKLDEKLDALKEELFQIAVDEA